MIKLERPDPIISYLGLKFETPQQVIKEYAILTGKVLNINKIDGLIEYEVIGIDRLRFIHPGQYLIIEVREFPIDGSIRYTVLHAIDEDMLYKIYRERKDERRYLRGM